MVIYLDQLLPVGSPAPTLRTDRRMTSKAPSVNRRTVIERLSTLKVGAGSDLPAGRAVRFAAQARAEQWLTILLKIAKQPAQPATWSCRRWGLPCRRRHRRRGALLPHHFTIACIPTNQNHRLCIFCGTFPGLPRWPLATTVALSCSDFPPSTYFENRPSNKAPGIVCKPTHTNRSTVNSQSRCGATTRPTLLLSYCTTKNRSGSFF